MRECPICRREFEDEFSVFVPPHPDGFDSIECAQKAALIWGAAGAAATPIVLPTIEVVPPRPTAETPPVPVPFARRGLAALAALAIVPSQVALAGGVGLAAAGTAASVYLAAKPVLQTPVPVAVSTTPADQPAQAPSVSESSTSPDTAPTSSNDTGSVDTPSSRSRRVARPLRPVARRSVVSTRPARRIHVTASAHVAHSSRNPKIPSPHATTSTAELASHPARETHPSVSTPPQQPKRPSHPKPKPEPDRAPAKPQPPAKPHPHPPAKPHPPASTPAPAPPSTTPAAPVSSTRVVAAVDSPPSKKEQKKQKKEQEQPTQQPAQPQAQPAPPPQTQAPTDEQGTSSPACAAPDDTKPGNGNGDKNHEHSGPPGQEDKNAKPDKAQGDDHGNGDGHGKGH